MKLLTEHYPNAVQTMLETINEKVSVVTFYNRTNGTVMPLFIKWQGRKYKMTKLGYHHKIKKSKYIEHIFSVSNKDMAFRLKLNTHNLHWILEEVSDGTPN